MMRVAVLILVASFVPACKPQNAVVSKTPRDVIRRAHADVLAHRDEDAVACYTGPAGFEAVVRATAAYTREAYALEDELNRVYGKDAMSKFRALAEKKEPSFTLNVPPKDVAWIDGLQIDESGDHAKSFDPFLKTEVQLVKKDGGWKISLEGLVIDPKKQAEIMEAFTIVLKEVRTHAAASKATLQDLSNELAGKFQKVFEGQGEHTE
jgi:hypothetical protein